MTNHHKLTGLIAATYTPFTSEGKLHLDLVGPLVEHLLAVGVQGVYVCGSTGEGMSLTSAERKQLAREFIRAADRRVPVIIQVGHNSVAEAAELAADAQAAGADVISATCPSYYPIGSVELLVKTTAEIAAGAPDLPFYYYNIPMLTGVDLPMTSYLDRAGKEIPSLAGLKFTKPAIHEFQQCLEFENGRYDILWGLDEMLLSALVVGAKGAIGSTYNIAAPLYLRLWNSFQSRELETARKLQSQAVEMIAAIAKYPFHPAMKEILRRQGFDCGPTRLPLPQLTSDQSARLKEDLEAIRFDQLVSPEKGANA